MAMTMRMSELELFRVYVRYLLALHQPADGNDANRKSTRSSEGMVIRQLPRSKAASVKMNIRVTLSRK